MKLKKILSSDIRVSHPNLSKGYVNDYYYTQLANKLQDDLINTNVDLEETTGNIIRCHHPDMLYGGHRGG